MQKLEALLATLGRHAQHVKLLSTASGTLHAQVRATALSCVLLFTTAPESAFAAALAVACARLARHCYALDTPGDGALRAVPGTAPLAHDVSAARACTWIDARRAWLQVETDSVTQGLEMAPLDVFPPESAAAAPTGLAPTPDGRFLDALGLDGDAAPRVEVVTKVLTHALAAAAATQPHYLLLSCGHTGRPVLHLMCAYQLPDGQLDHKSALHIWMISRADDE